MKEQLLMILPMMISIAAVADVIYDRFILAEREWNDEDTLPLTDIMYAGLWLLVMACAVSRYTTSSCIFNMNAIIASAICGLTSFKTSITISMVYSEKRRRLPLYSKGEDPILTYENLIKADILICMGFWIALVCNYYIVK